MGPACWLLTQALGAGGPSPLLLLTQGGTPGLGTKVIVWLSYGEMDQLTADLWRRGPLTFLRPFYTFSQILD